MKNNLRITVAQINTTVGDIRGNTNKIIASAIFARDKQGADLIVFPELALTGYSPQDLLLRPALYNSIKKALTHIRTTIKNIYILLGSPTIEQNGHFNTAILLGNKKIIAQYHKKYLPNYGVFDEKRYFTAGNKPCVVTIKNTKIAIAICEDIWFADPIQAAIKEQAQLMLSINASPFTSQKPCLRQRLLKQRATEGKIPIIYVNSVGAQDELVFDGGSMVVNAQGTIVQQAGFFAETLMPIDITIASKLQIKTHPLTPPENTEKMIYQALVLGVRDYITKNHLKGVIIGLSGGIDSALTLAIAIDALGKNRVTTIYLPSRYSSELSAQITTEMTKKLKIKHKVLFIEPILQTYLNNWPKQWGQPTKTVLENLQARCRSTLIMTLANQKNLLVLATGNKSELAVGYTTLYGDLAGGFCALKDVPKTLVYRLAKYRNQIAPIIPEAAISRAPTAELAANQKDTDNLPPYPILDEILERYLELDQSRKEIIAAGFDSTTVIKVIKMVQHNEYKRRQAPPGIKITTKTFGCERRYPITSRFYM